MTPALRLVLVLVLMVIGYCTAAGGGRVDLWPMPKSVSRGAKTLYVAKDLKLSTVGSKYSDGKAILTDAFKRMVAVMQMDHVINGSYETLPVLSGVNVVFHSTDDELKFGVDESYKLTLPAPGNPMYAQIEAQTVFSCLGDTARHYLPVPVIKSVIDSMIDSKLSFPIEVPSYPKLSNGAYSYSEKHTMDDAVDIVQYAEKRGVNVLAKIDVPGHACSWGVGYPSLWPSASCQQPLDASTDFTFKVINGILSDFSKVFKFKFVHLGGDKVNTKRLWTPIEKLAKDATMVTARLARFRCLLNERGVAAAPLAGYGRSAPSEPG